MIVNVLDNPWRDNLKFNSGQLVPRSECLSEQHLDEKLDFIFTPKVATLNGIVFRKNELIGIKQHQNEYYPTYGIIREIVLINGKVSLLLRLCDTISYNEYLEAYEVEVSTKDELKCLEECFTHAVFSFWSPYGNKAKFISRRFYNRDY